MSDRGLDVAIVGGGIGGLTTALFLLEAGIRPRIFEQAREFGEVGAGIQLAPNAIRLLHRLGLADALAEVAVAPEVAWEFRRWDDGRLISRTATADEHVERYGAPYYVIHRAHLIEILLAQIPGELLQRGHRCEAVEDLGSRVRMTFDDREPEVADAVIAVDGVGSVLRDAMLDADARPAFTGYCAYRGLIPAEQTALSEMAEIVTAWLGPERHFVHYPVSGGLMNLVGLVPRPEWPAGPRPAQATIDDFAADFAGWHPRLLATIRALDETMLWPLYAGRVLPRWVTGRTALLGDAAHAMLPFVAQGACQAIEDAATLAACLTDVSPSGVPAALRRYEQLRMPRARRVQELASEMAVTYHLPDGRRQLERDRVLAEGGEIGLGDWLYLHDAQDLSAQPSIATIPL